MKPRTVYTVLILFFCSLMLTGCLGFGKKKPAAPKMTKPAGAISIGTEKSRDGANSHPKPFTADEMKKELSILVVNQYDMGKWIKKSKWIPKPLFINAVINDLSTKLALGFSNAGPSDVVTFSVPGRYNKTTQGRIWFKNKTLTWEFDKVDGMPFTGSDKFWMDNHDWRIAENQGLTIIENKEKHRIKVERNLMVDPQFMDPQAMEDHNWRKGYTEGTDASATVQPVTQPAPQAVPAPAPVQTRPKVTDLPDYQTAEQKLELLKKWHEKGLISPDEYQKEKTKILNTF